jgi:hypothetical protein
VGAGVSSVVCAIAPIDNAPDNARNKTANPVMNLLFMNTSSNRARTNQPQIK